MGGRRNIRHRYHIDGGCCSDLYVPPLKRVYLYLLTTSLSSLQFLHLVLRALLTYARIA
jgi:hypothetical protein